jgi:hypothetical protein
VELPWVELAWVGLAWVGLAEMLVDEPRQITVFPEKVTFGFWNTLTTKDMVALVPEALVAEQNKV